jgi:undecaprenyl-diphosphatase
VLSTFLALGVLALLTWPAREALFENVAGGAAASSLAGFAGLVADKGLLVLLAVTAGLALVTWLRDRPGFGLLAAAGVGTVAAYATSEIVKLLVTEERPCRVVDVATVLACPAPGDWSWPSNHATIAGALAVACLLVVPRLWPVIVPVALAVAGARVAAGVHYVHDVVSGLALGVVVTCLVALAVHAGGQRLMRRSTSRRSPAARRTTGR